MNYLLIHRASNLIVSALTTDKPVHPNPKFKVVPVSDLVLDKYYATEAKHKGSTLVDAGEFALISQSFLEALKAN